MTNEQDFTKNWTPDIIGENGNFYEKGKVEIMLFEYAQRKSLAPCSVFLVRSENLIIHGGFDSKEKAEKYINGRPSFKIIEIEIK